MKRLWIVGAGLLLLLLSGAGYRWWHSASTTTASIQPAPANNLVLGSSISLQTWQTSLFTTQRPSNWRLLQSTENPSGPQLASYLWTGTDKAQSNQLAVTVGALGNNALNEISAVRLRANQATTYTPQSFSYAPPGAIGYEQMNGYEAALFWQHGGQYVAVVASGAPQYKADLNQALQAVVSNWSWR